MSETPVSAVNAPVAEPLSLSPVARFVAIFARPVAAWTGLRERTQWWIPMLAMMLLASAGTAFLHQRAVVPMISEQFDQQVESGKMTSQQAEKTQAFFEGPGGIAFSVGQQVVLIPIVTALIALVIWFGVGFVLGTPFRYRHALEVSAWANLINIPGYLLAFTEAWAMQTFKGVHTGFGALLPGDAHSKLMVGLGIVLDALGPLALWYLAVGILGAAALSGAPRKSVAWVLSSLYVVMVLISAALGAMFTPSA